MSSADPDRLGRKLAKKSSSVSLSLKGLMSRRSKSKLRTTSPTSSTGSIPPVPSLPSPTSTSFLPLGAPPSPPPSEKSRGGRSKQKKTSDKDRERDVKVRNGREKARGGGGLGESEWGDSIEPVLTLDTNLDNMDGVVDMRLVKEQGESLGNIDGTTVGGSSRRSHDQDDACTYQGDEDSSEFSGGASIFSNPFAAGNSSPNQPHPYSVSPKTVVVPASPSSPLDTRNALNLIPRNSLNGKERLSVLHDPSSPGWTPPESWSVDNQKKQEDEDALAESSDEDAQHQDPTAPRQDQSSDPDRQYTNGYRHTQPNGYHSSPMSPLREKERDPLDKRKSKRWQPFKLRIYRADNNYHAVSIAPVVTVADLEPLLNKRLLLGNDVEAHRLYIKEKGRGEPGVFCVTQQMLSRGGCTERVLAATERPADILRRRLHQAGYDSADRMEEMGLEDLTFLIKFVYKSNLLGPAVSPCSWAIIETIYQ
jgi:adenylate cyclase